MDDFATIEELIRAGQFLKARGLINEIKNKIKDIPKRTLLASYCRRCGDPLLGLGILHSNVGVALDTRSNALDDQEMCLEYAANLIRYGALSEGKNLLRKIDARRVPRANLFLAFASFAEWDYDSAIPGLETYLTTPLSGYDAIIGKVNLAAAYVESRQFDKVRSLLGGMLSDLPTEPYKLLKGNMHELFAQNEINAGNYPKALEHLEFAHGLLPGDSGVFSLFVTKWETICRSLMNRKLRHGLAPIRKKALSLQHWETLRECDLYQGYLSREADLVHKTKMATPYPTFHLHIDRVGKIFDLSYSDQPWIWHLSPSHGRTSHCLIDRDRGLQNGIPIFGTERLLHRAFLAITSDLYRPATTGALFNAMFPDERFSPQNTPNRIRQILFRLRQLLADQRIPLLVNEDHGRYRLEAVPGNHVSIEYSRRGVDPRPQWLDRIKRVSSFSSAEFAKLAGMSKRTAIRTLNEGISQGLLTKNRIGREIRYSVLSE
jgi:hypothetical protein